MELWTEYEGRVIDGAFPLERLLLPEGRSAFFSTSNGKGEPTVIRLIASHFDEEEILARWRGVEALGHPNILKLEKYGQLMLDETTVVYAVMEPVDANLAAVIGGQRLTVAEARQLAASLASALDVLHVNGFVHEHVEPSNVFAVGEVVKLRGDCIRETPEGESGLAAKRKDIHDLAIVILQSLTQVSTLEAAGRQLPLPAPLDQIVRNGVSGAWSAVEIMAALQTGERPSNPPPAAASSPTQTAVNKPAEPDTKTAAKPVVKAAIKPESERDGKPGFGPKSAASEARAIPETRLGAVRVASSADRPPLRIESWLRRDSIESWLRENSPKTGLIVAGVVVALLALWLGWHFAHSRPANHETAGQTISAPVPAPVTEAAPAGAARSLPVPNAASGSHGDWRVVAYTYNREDQAQKKRSTVALKHPELRPEVFTPTGHAPYLVTLGGGMSRDEAFALVQKARAAGLARDTYAQNYPGQRR
ncbi:SPOR domain-containing protein [Acidicapsa acidisoli]|uniref:SPOR domain-containing protein n=1 Tax=Acidicapsa acidisoli TaxID=1615681 RepID=UPI0021E02743|nr:SPOR domain-containing protein [Acidicapsa acidisoli]